MRGLAALAFLAICGAAANAAAAAPAPVRGPALYANAAYELAHLTERPAYRPASGDHHWPAEQARPAIAAGVDAVQVSLARIASAGHVTSQPRYQLQPIRLQSGVLAAAGRGDPGALYLFAAASGRAIGLNLEREAQRLDRAAWRTSDLITEAQLGLGWRNGDMQSSVGYIYRELKGRHAPAGQRPRGDSLLGLSVSLTPPQ